MKYLIVGIFTLFVAILVSRVFIALDLVNKNTFTNKLVTEVKVEESKEVKLSKIGKKIYFVLCSSCHGMDGKGNNDKAQNHTKRISKKSVLDIINNGSNNFINIYPSGMPAGLVDRENAEELALYISHGMTGKKPKSWKICASCHNENGEGIAFIAPNIKVYSNELVATVLKNGKKGVIGTMPNFGDRLSEIQMKALATYIRSIAK